MKQIVETFTSKGSTIIRYGAISSPNFYLLVLSIPLVFSVLLFLFLSSIATLSPVFFLPWWCLNVSKKKNKKWAFSHFHISPLFSTTAKKKKKKRERKIYIKGFTGYMHNITRSIWLWVLYCGCSSPILPSTCLYRTSAICSSTEKCLFLPLFLRYSLIRSSL